MPQRPANRIRCFPLDNIGLEDVWRAKAVAIEKIGKLAVDWRLRIGVCCLVRIAAFWLWAN